MYIGKPLRRREDVKFLKGRGRYVDDMAPRDAAWVAFVRSPHAHARILRIETAAAAELPGVLKVLTAADWAAAGLGELTCVHPMPFPDGTPINEARRPMFSGGKLRHMGDGVHAYFGYPRVPGTTDPPLVRPNAHDPRTMNLEHAMEADQSFRGTPRQIDKTGR